MLPKLFSSIFSWLLGPAWVSSLVTLLGLLITAYESAPAIFKGSATKLDYFAALTAISLYIVGRMSGQAGAVVAPPGSTITPTSTLINTNVKVEVKELDELKALLTEAKQVFTASKEVVTPTEPKTQ